MKHQYFGDVNDYLKYGLLRCFSQAGLKVGVCWMLTPDDLRTDGLKVQYLARPTDWKRHDPELFDHLARTLKSNGGRHLRHIEQAGHIPHARFFSAIVPDARERRAHWFEHMLSTLKGSDLVFFDPDNGIEVASKAIGQKDSSKYVYWQELAQTWTQSESLLVFQHFPRLPRGDYIAARIREMQLNLPGSSITPLQSSNVLFLLSHRGSVAAPIAKALDLIDANWSGRVSRPSGKLTADKPAAIFRPASPADAPAIDALAYEVNLQHFEQDPAVFAPPAQAVSPASQHLLSGAGDGVVYLAEVDGQVVGFIYVMLVEEMRPMFRPVRYARIDTFGVTPRRRRQGLGKQLMARVEEWATGANCEEIRLNVWMSNQQAIDLYEALGYTPMSMYLGKALKVSH